MLSTGATLGQDSVARQVANPGAHCTTRAVLGCAYGALLACAAPLECSVIPDLLEILLLQASVLVCKLLFMKKPSVPS